MSTSITIHFVQGDDLPLIRVQLIDQATDQPVNIAAQGITGTLRFREYMAAESLFDAPMAPLDNGIYGWLQVSAWPENAFDLDAGIYEAQIILTQNDLTQTMVDRIRIRLHEQFEAPE